MSTGDRIRDEIKFSKNNKNTFGLFFIFLFKNSIISVFNYLYLLGMPICHVQNYTASPFGFQFYVVRDIFSALCFIKLCWKF